MKLPSRALLLACSALLASQEACKPKPPEVVIKLPDGTEVEPPPPPSDADETAAAALAAEARQLDQQKQADAAKAKLDQLVERYPGTAAGAAELEARADSARKQGDEQGAISWYEKLLFFRPSYPNADRARLSYAELLVHVHR